MDLHHVTERFSVNDVDLSQSVFNKATRASARLHQLELSGVRFNDGDVTGLQLTDVTLSDLVIRDANLSGREIVDSRLTGATIDGIAIETRLEVCHSAQGDDGSPRPKQAMAPVPSNGGSVVRLGPACRPWGHPAGMTVI